MKLRLRRMILPAGKSAGSSNALGGVRTGIARDLTRQRPPWPSFFGPEFTAFAHVCHRRFPRNDAKDSKYPAIYEHLRPFKKRLMPGVPAGVSRKL